MVCSDSCTRVDATELTISTMDAEQMGYKGSDGTQILD